MRWVRKCPPVVKNRSGNIGDKYKWIKSCTEFWLEGHVGIWESSLPKGVENLDSIPRLTHFRLLGNCIRWVSPRGCIMDREIDRDRNEWNSNNPLILTSEMVH